MHTQEFVQNEIQVADHLKNNQLLCLPKYVLEENDYTFMIYEEKKNEKNLLQLVNKYKCFKEDIAREIFRRMVQCVLECHKNNVIHRDIKLPAFYVNEETLDVTLGDLRHASILSSKDQQVKDRRGSPAYVSPEIIRGTPFDGQKSDCWSLGIVLYTMIFGSFPFNGQNPKELFQQILKQEPVLSQNVSSQLVSLLSELLQKDPKKRISLKAVLKHPWLASDTQNEDQIVPNF